MQEIARTHGVPFSIKIGLYLEILRELLRALETKFKIDYKQKPPRNKKIDLEEYVLYVYTSLSKGTEKPRPGSSLFMATLTIKRTNSNVLSIHRVTLYSKDIPIVHSETHRLKDIFCVHKEVHHPKKDSLYNTIAQCLKESSNIHRRSVTSNDEFTVLK
ncbi:hypothetical protein CR513_51634, partial [Mucuna pruriens]